MKAIHALEKALLPYHEVLVSAHEEPMSRHTSFRIGGPAELWLEPLPDAPLGEILQLISSFELPLFVVGRGSNLLVREEGLRGVVLCTGRMNRARVEGETIVAQAGVPLALLAKLALDNGLTGAEFAAGIPGSVGGAVFMNAGAYGRQMCDIVTESAYFLREGTEGHITGADHVFGYRDSIYKKHPEYMVYLVSMRLQRGDPVTIRQQMDELAKRRTEKQPLEYPSAGSTFKRPEGYFAGALIEQAGLKGYTVGGAQVSEKHAGFVINRGGATADDVLKLIEAVQQRVQDCFGIQLECEVQLL